MACYNYILFDLDGTLTDPMVGITKSVQYGLSKCGVIEDNLEKLTPFIGPPLMDSFMEYYSFSESKAKQAIEYYREYFSVTGKFENKVYSGVSDMLSLLKCNKCKLIIATSKPTVFSEDILKHFDLMDYFDIVIGSELDGSRASKEDVIQYVLSLIGPYDKREVIMVGDRKFDILGAKSAGIDSIAVTYGYGSMEELDKCSPTFFADSIDELRQLLCSGF